jgi:hypothetical protein
MYKMVNGKRQPMSTEEIESQKALEETAKIAQRRVDAKAECSRRIRIVVDEVAQINLAASAAAGALSSAQMTTYQNGVAWIAATRTVWKDLADDGRVSITKDSNWPTPSQEIIELGALF